MTHKLVIENPQLWASSQGYRLTEGYHSSLSVFLRDKPIGALVPTAGGFKFVDTDTAEYRTVQESSLCESTSSTDTIIEYSDDDFVSRSFGLSDVLPFALDSLKKGANEIDLGAKVSGTGFSERVSDCNYWLPYAAEHYHLSRDIRDYVLVPIPAIFSDLPNTNGDSLALNEMLKFNPEMGMQMYKTFKGKPTYLEHANQDITKAKGVILDSFLRPVPFNRKYYKIVQLLAYDRTKDSMLAESILSKSSNAYSVGFYYSSYTCSICGTRVGKGLNLSPCSHTQMRRPTYRQSDGRLAYRKCENAVGFECSAVGTPAFVSAIGPNVYDPRNL